jgi:hypothetical protein
MTMSKPTTEELDLLQFGRVVHNRPVPPEQEIRLLRSQLANCHAEIFKLREQLLSYAPLSETRG